MTKRAWVCAIVLGLAACGGGNKPASEPPENVAVAKPRSKLELRIAGSPAFITNAELAECKAILDNPDGKLAVGCLMTEAGTAAMARETTANVDKQLEIVVDGEVKETVTIFLPIEQPTFYISLGAGATPAQAHELAAALSP
jgi:preprotein translocase subunit SecD